MDINIILTLCAVSIGLVCIFFIPMSSRFYIQVLEQYLPGKVRVKKEPYSSEEKAVLQSPSTDADEKTDLMQGKSSEGLYSLIIGINSYSSLSVLKGAVNDADDMANYLMADLGISPDRIVNLRNEQATRKRIIKEFQNLWKNPRINHGDPILIYYAGHGGLTKATEQWKARYGTQKIQVIFPHDYGQEVEGSTNLAKVNCIPDKTVAQMLNELASKKGDNITMIFDSCHSESGNRDDETNLNPAKRDRRYRSAEVQHDLEIPVDIDNDITAPIGTFISIKQHRGAGLLLNTDQNSHIHFAACGVHQKAIEENGRGLFTTELLKKLRENDVDKITYHNLLRSLKLPKEQSPQCYGKHKDRILFDSRVPSRNIVFIHVELNVKDNSWVLKAGAASGVTLESIWELHKSPSEISEFVGRFKVKELYGSSAILEPLDRKQLSAGGGDHILYGRFKQHGSENELVLNVWASPKVQDLLFPGPDQHIGSAHQSGVGYKMVSTRGDADVALEIHNPESTKPQVAFYWYDAITRSYDLEKLEHRKPAIREEVEVVLFAASRWRWHLQRTNTNQVQNMETNMLKIGTKAGPRAHREYLKEPETLEVQNGVAKLVVDNTALYGLKLQNNLNSSLYIRLFYFDATDFSIGDMFGHNIGNGEFAPNITPRSQLLVGDGADGEAPLKFDISPSNEAELGYMKVFWSTEPLELDIKQKSAFQLRLGELEGRGAYRDSDSLDSKWGTECLPVVLRRELAS